MAVELDVNLHQSRFFDSPVEGYIFIRLVIAIGLLIIVSVLWLVSQSTFPIQPFHISAFACLLMGGSAMLVRRFKQENWFIWSQVIIDTLFASALVLVSGDPNSTYSIIYFMSVVAAARMFPPRGVLLVAGTNAVFFGLVSMLGLFGDVGWKLEGAVHEYYPDVLLRIFGLMLVGVLSTGLVSRGALSAQIERTEILQRAHTVLLDRLPVAIISVEDGIVRESNSFAARTLGVRVGLPLALQGETNKDSWETQLKIDGENRWLSCRRRRMEGGGQVYILEDITRLREIEAQLERDERLTVVGRLAASLAHEIRNPLASLSGSVQLLEEREPNPLHRIVMREVQRLNDLVEEFLQAARPLRLTVVQTNLEEMLHEVVQTFQNDPRCRDLRKVQLDMSELSPLHADPSRLRQVIWNLLVNAVQATEVGGQIAIKAWQDDTQICVQVEDDGVGIEPDNLIRIFDPFYTTRSGGTGLGLANVDRIVRAHGGEVRVNSELGQGTSFMIWLPRFRGEDMDGA